MIAVMIILGLIVFLNILIGVGFNKWSLIDFLIIRLFLFIANFSIDESLVSISRWFTIDILSFGLLILTLFLFKLIYLSRSLVFNKNFYSLGYNLFFIVVIVETINKIFNK